MVLVKQSPYGLWRLSDGPEIRGTLHVAYRYPNQISTWGSLHARTLSIANLYS